MGANQPQQQWFLLQYIHCPIYHILHPGLRGAPIANLKLTSHQSNPNSGGECLESAVGPEGRSPMLPGPVIITGCWVMAWHSFWLTTLWPLYSTWWSTWVVLSWVMSWWHTHPGNTKLTHLTLQLVIGSAVWQNCWGYITADFLWILQCPHTVLGETYCFFCCLFVWLQDLANSLNYQSIRPNFIISS